MLVINRKDMDTDKFSSLSLKLFRDFCWNAPHRKFTLSTFLALVALLAFSFGCAPNSSTGDGKQNEPVSSASTDLPELTEEMIRERINETRVRQVPEENGAAEPINWNFREQDPEEITVVNKQIEGDRATIILEVKTQSAPKAREQRSLAGQIRTEWKLQTGWVLRKWELVKTENISMKYRNLPKLPTQNSNN